MGPLDKYILSEDALRTSPEGGRLQFRSHWYRSLPLSCMDFDIKLNGTTVEPDAIQVEVNTHHYPFRNMRDLFDEWLFILDAVIIHFQRSEPLTKGTRYEIEFDLRLHIPYVLVGGEGKPLMVSSKVVKSLTCS